MRVVPKGSRSAWAPKLLDLLPVWWNRYGETAAKATVGGVVDHLDIRGINCRVLNAPLAARLKVQVCSPPKTICRVTTIRVIGTLRIYVVHPHSVQRVRDLLSTRFPEMLTRVILTPVNSTGPPFKLPTYAQRPPPPPI
jgi:hypothetical protein